VPKLKPKKYRKKPIVVEAVKWDGSAEAHCLIEEWVGDGIEADFTKADVPIIIPTLEGDYRAHLGDYIIKGIKDEIYPCREDIFERTYEEVKDA